MTYDAFLLNKHKAWQVTLLTTWGFCRLADGTG